MIKAYAVSGLATRDMYNGFDVLNCLQTFNAHSEAEAKGLMLELLETHEKDLSKYKVSYLVKEIKLVKK